MIIFKDLTGWPSRKSLFHQRKKKNPAPGTDLIMIRIAKGRVEYTDDSTWIFLWLRIENQAESKDES